MQTALEWSLNTGFVTIAERLGDGTSITRTARDTMYQYFHDRLGIGTLTGIELANEAPGSLAAPSTSEGNAVKYANVSFGQGMDATMVQVASGFSALINGGTYYKPTVISGSMNDGQYVAKDTVPPVATGIVSADTSNTLRAMMQQARRSAFGSQDKAGYSIGGKTGTAQVAVPGGYSKTESIGSYLGYGGTDTPEYVIMVAVSGKDKAFQGSTHAMPIFNDISGWMIDYLKIQPKG
jgi:cell division protein FtsI/penicillin-binding protein 2